MQTRAVCEMNGKANTRTEEKDLIIIGGGVAGYVAAIKAGQEGLKVPHPTHLPPNRTSNSLWYYR